MKKNPGMGFKNGKKRGEWAELVFAMRATELGLPLGRGPGWCRGLKLARRRGLRGV